MNELYKTILSINFNGSSSHCVGECFQAKGEYEFDYWIMIHECTEYIGAACTKSNDIVFAAA